MGTAKAAGYLRANVRPPDKAAGSSNPMAQSGPSLATQIAQKLEEDIVLGRRLPRECDHAGMIEALRLLRRDGLIEIARRHLKPAVEAYTRAHRRRYPVGRA